MATTDQVEGLVERTNDKGIFVAGEWRNFSKFHPLEGARPDRGARVRLDLDAKGFINALQVLDGAPSSTSSPASSERERTISRLSVLKAAAAFGASRPEMKSADVLKVADAWLAWVEKPAGET